MPSRWSNRDRWKPNNEYIHKCKWTHTDITRPERAPLFDRCEYKIHCKIFHPEAIYVAFRFSYTVPSSINSFRLFKTLLHLPELPLFLQALISPNKASCGYLVKPNEISYSNYETHTNNQFFQPNFPLKYQWCGYTEPTR